MGTGLRRHGDGFLSWLGFTAVGTVLYGCVAGAPTTLHGAGLFVIVPVVFGSVMTIIRAIGERL